jgi:hypothetical protein
MMVTVTYQGVPIVRSSPAREEGATGIFVECEFPMPVGSRLEVQLERGAGVRPARVVRVVEAAQGAGMSVEWTGEAEPTATELMDDGANGSGPTEGGGDGVTTGERPEPSGGHGGGRRKRRR